jgi:outer membrane protein assembly factor BamB
MITALTKSTPFGTFRNWLVPRRSLVRTLLFGLLAAGLTANGLGCADQGTKAANRPDPATVEPVPSGLPSDAESFPKLDLKQDWPWWRGPGRNGHAPEGATPPTRLDVAKAKWEAPVPGRGHGSPIVVGNRVFLLTAMEAQQQHSVLAYDRATGELVWQTEINQGGFPDANHPKNTEASPTLACDGEKIFATAYHHDKVELTALDLAGKIVWRADLGRYRPRQYEYGYAASPVLYRDMVIVAAEYDGPSSIQAFRRSDGTPVWKTERPQNITFSSPTIAHLQGRDQLLISGGQRIVSYDPSTGDQQWEVKGAATATCGTAVWDTQRVFASGGYPQSETVAIELGATPKRQWSVNQKCYEQSMIVIDGCLYALTDNGILFCWNAADGSELWKQRFRGPVSASPVYAGGHLYCANEGGSLYVVKPNTESCQLIEENQVGNDSFPSPAIAGNQIFLRVANRTQATRQEVLYCFE